MPLLCGTLSFQLSVYGEPMAPFGSHILHIISIFLWSVRHNKFMLHCWVRTRDARHAYTNSHLHFALTAWLQIRQKQSLPLVYHQTEPYTEKVNSR